MNININTKYSIGDQFCNGHFEIVTIMLNIRKNSIEVLYNLKTCTNDVITVNDEYLKDLGK